jgi:hypothetical protein
MNDENQIKKSLDQLAENLDEDTLNQLNRARQKAISINSKPKWYQNISWPMLGPAFVAAVLVVVLLVSNQSQIIKPPSDSFLDDLDLLANEVDTDLLEDLEFIAWLEEENVFEGELL